MKKLIFVTNIPTPYRYAIYDELSKYVDLEIIYHSLSEEGRYWTLDKKEYKQSVSFFKSLNLKGLYFYLSLDIVWYLIKNRNEKIIVGGSWTYPFTLLVSFFARLGIIKNSYFWSEGNLIEELHSKQTLLGAFKGFVYSGFSNFIVPGEKAKELVNHYNHKAICFRLPNLISSNDFYDEKVSINRDILICSRLIKLKNVDGFLKSVIELLPRYNVNIHIAGDGPEMDSLKKIVENSASKKHVHFYGHLSSGEIIDLYKNFSFFCLPSLRESYSLSVIEALHSSMILMLSERIGNIPECLNSNGVSFNPFSRESIEKSFKDLFELQDCKLLDMANASLNVARNKFDLELEVKRFINVLYED